MCEGSYFRFSWDFEKRRQSKPNKRAASKWTSWPRWMGGARATKKSEKKETCLHLDNGGGGQHALKLSTFVVLHSRTRPLPACVCVSVRACVWRGHFIVCYIVGFIVVARATFVACHIAAACHKSFADVLNIFATARNNLKWNALNNISCQQQQQRNTLIHALSSTWRIRNVCQLSLKCIRAAQLLIVAKQLRPSNWTPYQKSWPKPFSVPVSGLSANLIPMSKLRFSCATSDMWVHVCVRMYVWVCACGYKSNLNNFQSLWRFVALRPGCIPSTAGIFLQLFFSLRCYSSAWA